MYISSHRQSEIPFYTSVACNMLIVQQYTHWFGSACIIPFFDDIKLVLFHLHSYEGVYWGDYRRSYTKTYLYIHILANLRVITVKVKPVSLYRRTWSSLVGVYVNNGVKIRLSTVVTRYCRYTRVPCVSGYRYTPLPVPRVGRIGFHFGTCRITCYTCPGVWFSIYPLLQHWSNVT